MHGQWDDISINKYDCGCARFILGTIRYDKDCTIK